ncbi:MAG: class I SAM-dependent DNA methyltransferase, partial [Deltaproteobacteria bacterium]|nr:class I SAM-dependent DNA methyltransferase [Deltaproteobacteria bacterium]
FKSIDNLFDPITIEESFDDKISGPVPGIRNTKGKWNLSGHPGRILTITQKELLVFSKLFDSSLNWKEARLPVIHTKLLLPILENLSNQKYTLESLGDNIFHTEMFHETNAQKDLIIKRHVHFPDNSLDTIYSGPHIQLANPFFKCSRKICTTKSDYDIIDLTSIPENYRPRVNYSPYDFDSYENKIPITKVGGKYHSYYRIIMRRMLGPHSDRTLLPAIIPKGFGHIHTIFGIYINKFLPIISACLMSIVYDFLIRSYGKSDLFFDTLKQLPLLSETQYFNCLSLRALLLNCLTSDYAELWSTEWNYEFSSDLWSKEDPRLSNHHFSNLTKEWSWKTPLRTDYARRQALIEIDVLTGMSLGLTLDQLQTIYRFEFPLLQSYENETYYDANGRIVFTSNRALNGVGFEKNEFDEIKDAKSGTFTRTIVDSTLSDTPTEKVVKYIAPFDKCRREEDYITAWNFFSSKFSKT